MIKKYWLWIVIGITLVLFVIFGMKGLLGLLLFGYTPKEYEIHREYELEQLKKKEDMPSEEKITDADDAIDYLNGILNDNKK